MTPAQQETIDRLTLDAGGTMCREGYSDGGVRVTLPTLEHGIVTADGTWHEAGIDASHEAVEWATCHV